MTFSSTAFCLSGKDTINMWVVSVKKINNIYANEHEDSKNTIWKHVTISEDLAELCLQDHQQLG
jgi:hypothetical protein